VASTFKKDPSAVLDYVFDWAALTNAREGAASDWLASGETISSHTIDADTGITVDSSALTDDDTSVTVWLSAGSDGTDYSVTCQIVTSAGRTEERSITIKVRQR